MQDQQRSRRVRPRTIFVLTLLALAPWSPRAAASGTVALTGAGSTFDAPFFAQAFRAYNQQHGVAVRYDAVGSGAGIQQFSGDLVDFAATDVPMNPFEQELAQQAGGEIVQIPVALGAVAIVYNEPNILARTPLRLSGSVLAAIFMGTIRRWNDRAIAHLNPGIYLPPDHILPVHRADSSGTTYIFTDFLSAADRQWARRFGRSKAVAWQGGFRGVGSDGLVSWVRRHEGSVGYVEVRYASSAHVPSARVVNRAGGAVPPSSRGIAAAAARFVHLSTAHFSLVNAPGRDSYPIAAYSWVVLRRHPRDPQRARVARGLFAWLVTAGQAYAGRQGYVPLPRAAQRTAQAALSSIR